MEIGIRPEMPTYAGGLGMLAGDTVRAAADLRVPMVAVTLLHRKGYFYQRLDENGWQVEEPVHWIVEDFLTNTETVTRVNIEGRAVCVRAWRHDVIAYSGFTVPVYFLDTALPGNSDWDCTLTDYLYGGDSRYRLCQEVVLGFGGIRILRELGYRDFQRYHMNEGHSALLTLELLREERDRAGRPRFEIADREAVHEKCVFTTHTAVPAGHDQFPLELAERVLGNREVCGLHERVCHEGRLNMTFLALALSHYVNGVAKKHGEVSQHLFAEYKIDAITNGVHAATWVAPPFAALLDRFIPGWRRDNFNFRYALGIPREEIWKAHLEAKQVLVEYVNREMNAGLDTQMLTIGFGRRATTYKRPDLVFNDLDTLRRLSRNVGQLQMVFSGKAHPNDEAGKRLIQNVIQCARTLRPEINTVFLPNYDMDLARLMTSGVDLWLNTPEPPFEASGTSGMKAALNAVPSLSVLDGWWTEGYIEGLTGWVIGAPNRPDERPADARSLYDTLAEKIIPLFYNDQSRFVEIMRHTIALNGSFFNAQRMLQQYVLNAYFE